MSEGISGSEAAPAGAERGETGPGAGIGRLVRRTVLTVLALSPLFFAPDVYFPYVVPRALLLYLVAQLCALHLIVLALRRGARRRPTSEPFLWLLAAFVAWGLAGALAGDAPVRSLFGNFERMGGLWRWIHLGLIFLWLRAVPDRTDWRYFWRAFAAVTAVVAAAAIYQRHGPPAALPVLPVPVPAGDRVTAAFGNPGYLAAYLLLAAGPLALLARRSGSVTGRAAALGTGAMVLYALLLTGTRAALGGLAIGATAVVAGAAVRRWRRRDRGVAAMLLLGLAGIGIAGAAAWAAGLAPAGLERAVERTLEGAGLRSRFLVWGVALEGFPDAPVLGVGMENFRLLFGEHFDPALYPVNPQATRWDRAHNLLLDRLTMTGVVGLTLYLGMWAALLGSLLRGRTEGRLAGPPAAVFLAALAGYGIFLLFWFEDHASLLLLLSIAAWLRFERDGAMLEFGRPPESVPARRWLLIGLSGLVLGVLAYRFEVGPWRAATATVSGARPGPEAPVAHVASPGSGPSPTPRSAPGDAAAEDGGLRGLDHFDEALDRTDVLEWNIVGQYAAALERASRLAAPLRPGSDRARDVAGHVERAASELEEALAWDERNPIVYVRKGQIYTAAFRFFRRPELMEVAVESFRRAIELNPRRIRFRHMLANAHLSAGRVGRARVQLDTARRIYPHFGETDYFYAAAYLAADRPDSAAAMVRKAVDRGYEPSDPSILVELLRRLDGRGESARAAELGRSYLAGVYEAYRKSGAPGRRGGADAPDGVPDTAGPDSLPARRQRVREFSLRRSDLPVAARVPVLYLRAGDPHNATATGQRLLIGLVGKRRPIAGGEPVRRATRFLADLEAGRTRRWRTAASVLEGPASPSGPASPGDANPDRGR